MNQFVPDWTSNMGGDAFAPMGVEDDGLMELQWCNGHVVMQSQAPRKPARSEKDPAAVQDDEAAAWFQYQIEDPLERDLFSELFGEAPADPGLQARKAEEECAAVAVTAPRTRLMPPPRKACVEDAGGKGTGATEAGGESSMLTIGSSFCGSNHVQTTPRAAPPPRGGRANNARARDAATVTSSSMQQPRTCAAAHRSGKRKQRDATENEDVEFESAVVTCEPAQKTTTAKRRRAAEVHNRSERRRRDRINEKMKALQELIPHCNKTDKASMLDEAIEYLKSLQFQLQVTWMGGGMAAAPVMFPTGMHQYMQRVVGSPHVASMPRLPPFMAPAPVQSPPVTDPYARCLVVDNLQPPAPMHYLQGMNFYQQQSPAPPQQPVVSGGSLPATTTAQTFAPTALRTKNTLNVLHPSTSKRKNSPTLYLLADPAIALPHCSDSDDLNCRIDSFPTLSS